VGRGTAAGESERARDDTASGRAETDLNSAGVSVAGGHDSFVPSKEMCQAGAAVTGVGRWTTCPVLGGVGARLASGAPPELAGSGDISWPSVRCHTRDRRPFLSKLQMLDPGLMVAASAVDTEL
jgi:hypothetical protein